MPVSPLVIPTTPFSNDGMIFTQGGAPLDSSFHPGSLGFEDYMLTQVQEEFYCKVILDNRE